MKGTHILTTQKSISFSKKIVKNLPLAIRKRLPREIAVIAVSPRESLRLNRTYRGKRKPTNVLSFLYGPEYGEIIICPAVIRKEAKTQGNAQLFQMTWMVLHGMLHLAGLHHEKSRIIAEKVERIEQGVLAAFLEKRKK